MQIFANQMAENPEFALMIHKGTKMLDRNLKTEAPTTQNPTRKTSSHQWPLIVGTVAAQAWMDMGTETIRFVWNRMQQDQKTQKALLACTSLEDMQQVHAAFLCQAREQYVAETRKIFDLMIRAATAGIGVGPTARRFDDVPL